MGFSNNLRTLIEERNMTQKELALQLNIAPSTLGCYVQNKREPDFATLKAIARYFKVSTDYLLDLTLHQSQSQYEKDLLRIFRSLSEDQQYICLEQCKVFLLMNDKGKKEQYYLIKHNKS